MFSHVLILHTYKHSALLRECFFCAFGRLGKEKMIELNGKYASAKVFTETIDPTAVSQIIELCN